MSLSENQKFEANLPDLFNRPVSQTKVRKNVVAYKYSNGCINIQGEKFFFYSIKDAIKIWRTKNPIN